jgi:hypothetical protein
MKILTEMGLDDAGYETMYNPITGKAYKCRIFFGVHYWERQAHLVEMKINVRNGGPRDPITGQPVKGRKRNGGQSLDHMTFDAQNAAGVTGILRDLHINQGSFMYSGACRRCNTMNCYFNQETENWTCPYCGPHVDIVVKKIPPATNLLQGLFNGLHVGLDYFYNIQDFNRDNRVPNNNYIKNMYKHYDSRIIAYNTFLEKYNFEHNIQHKMATYKDSKSGLSVDDYKPLTLQDIMYDYERCSSKNNKHVPQDFKTFSTELEQKIESRKHTLEKLLQTENE